MSHPTFVVSLLVGLVALLALGLGIVVLREPPAPDAESYVAREDYDDLAARHRQLAKLADEHRAQTIASSRRSRELESRVAALTAELESQRDRAAATEEEALLAQASTAPVSFGRSGDLDAVKNANWSELGEAVDTMNGLMLELLESVGDGEVPDAELQNKIRQENNKLVRYAAQLMGKISTHSPINGEFSHPITLANLIDPMLEHGDLPLAAEQRAEIASLGNEYEREYDRLQATYTEETTRFEKFMDELELKRDAKRGMESVLTDAQLELLTHPALRDRSQLDPLSPAVMTAMIAGTKNVQSVEELRGRLPEYFSEWFGIEEAPSGALGDIADAWLEDMRPLLNPLQKSEKFLHLDRMIIAGRAQVSAMNRLLRLQAIDEKARKAILNHMGWRVPQIVEKPPSE